MQLVEWVLLQIGDDQSWQSHLTEAERAYCYEWAARQFENSFAQTKARVKGQLREINVLLGQPALDRADLIKALLGDETPCP